MTKLLWNDVGDRVYEIGVDRGVLYLPDGSGIVWNGLTSVTENANQDSQDSPYIDGVKLYDSSSNNNYSATLKVLTYPDEFLPFDGVESLGEGLYIKDQKPGRFSLSYRTRIGNDINGDDHGYKIHLIYNLAAVPEARSYLTLSDQDSLVEFGWEIASIPEVIPGYKPTAYAIIDTTRLNSYLLEDLENILYGTEITEPRLPPLSELVDLVESWELITIVDHGDGTWSATGPEELIIMLNATTFQISEVDGIYLDSFTYEISTTHA